MDVFERPVLPRVLDFRGQREIYYARDDKGLMRVVDRGGRRLDMIPGTEQSQIYEGKTMGSPGVGLANNRAQIRARARRRLRRGEKLTDEAWTELYKPLEEWDMEELARGRPRDGRGNFTGRPPKYVTRELHERAMERFKMLIRDEMNAQSMSALKTIQMVLESEEVDMKGKPVVPASAKMDAAKFLLEHIVGKPVQPTQTDISVKLQGILGTVMVNPTDLPGQFAPAHMGTRELVGEVDDEDGDE